MAGVLEDGSVVLVRGGDLDPDILSEDAARYHSICGVRGISVFAVRDATTDELAQQASLVRLDRLSLLTVGDVLAVGMRLSRPAATRGISPWALMTWDPERAGGR
jgi:hypothetical protein